MKNREKTFRMIKLAYSAHKKYLLNEEPTEEERAAGEELCGYDCGHALIEYVEFLMDKIEGYTQSRLSTTPNRIEVLIDETWEKNSGI